MRFLLDTNHWSSIQRRHPRVMARLDQLPSDATISMPVVAQAELLAGVECLPPGSRRDEVRRLYEELVGDATDILPVDSSAAERFAGIFAQLRRDGRPIETNDMWIGAIALAHDLVVVSSDAHFQFIRGLAVQDWTESVSS